MFRYALYILNLGASFQPVIIKEDRVILSPASLSPIYLFSANFKDFHAVIAETPGLEPASGFSYTKIDLTCFWNHFAKKYLPNLQAIVKRNWGKREILFHFFPSAC